MTHAFQGPKASQTSPLRVRIPELPKPPKQAPGSVIHKMLRDKDPKAFRASQIRPPNLSFITCFGIRIPRLPKQAPANKARAKPCFDAPCGAGDENAGRRVFLKGGDNAGQGCSTRRIGKTMVLRGRFPSLWKIFKLAGRRVFLKSNSDIRRGCLRGRPWEKRGVEGAVSETISRRSIL